MKKWLYLLVALFSLESFAANEIKLGLGFDVSRDGPRSFEPLLYISIMLIAVVLYGIFGVSNLRDDSVITILFVLVFFLPLIVLQESRKTNKRIDVLYELLKNKHFVGE